MLIYIVSAIAETNRAPFDLRPRRETEQSPDTTQNFPTSMKFAMFFMGEYANMVVVSAVAATLWFGGFTAPLPGLGHVWG